MNFTRKRKKLDNKKKQRTYKRKREGTESGTRAIQDDKLTRLSPARGTPNITQDIGTNPEEKKNEGNEIQAGGEDLGNRFPPTPPLPPGKQGGGGRPSWEAGGRGEDGNSEHQRPAPMGTRNRLERQSMGR